MNQIEAVKIIDKRADKLLADINALVDKFEEEYQGVVDVSILSCSEMKNYKYGHKASKHCGLTMIVNESALMDLVNSGGLTPQP